MENPVLTTGETSISITVFGDTEETEESTIAQVDNALQVSLISRAMVERLRVYYEYNPPRYGPITDSRNRTHRPVGETKLRWHRNGSPKSHPHVFRIVDGLTPDVILGATALPKGKENDVSTLGLSRQTDGNNTPFSCYYLSSRHSI